MNISSQCWAIDTNVYVKKLVAYRHLLLVCLDQSSNNSKRSKSQILKWPETICKLVKGNKVQAESGGGCVRKSFNDSQKNKTSRDGGDLVLDTVWRKG